eukprot:10872687-Alexandrium_andersonii.AAC.1
MMTSQTVQRRRLGRAAAGRKVPNSSEGGGARRRARSRARACALASSSRSSRNQGSGRSGGSRRAWCP